MLKSVLLFAVGMALVGVAYGLVKTAIAGDGLGVDPGLVVTMAVTGVLGGYIAWRKNSR